MDNRNEQNLVSNNESHQKLKVNNYCPNPINIKLGNVLHLQIEQTPKDVNQILQKERIPSKAKFNEENPLSKDVLNPDLKNNNIINSLELVIQNSKTENNFLILNYYWIELLGSISLCLTLIIYEYLARVIYATIKTLVEIDENFIDNIENCFKAAFDTIGFKWIFFITMGSHLSVGFFCLKTFSNVLNETKSIKKFYIFNFIKFALYYAVSIIIVQVIIINGLGSFFHNLLKAYALKIKISRLFLIA